MGIDSSIVDVGLKRAASGALVRANILTVGDLVALHRQEVLLIPGIGETLCDHIILTLSKHRLKLSTSKAHMIRERIAREEAYLVCIKEELTRLKEELAQELKNESDLGEHEWT